MTIRPIIHDTNFLCKPSRPAKKADRPIAQDLLDTIKTHEDRCVGMAANMIGELVRLIVVNDNGKYIIMYDPRIVSRALPYETEETCLSIAGIHPCTRYELIEVEYRDFRFKKKKERFAGFTAQIIQHEIDHLEGILV